MASKPTKSKSAWQEGKAPASVEEYCQCLDASRVMLGEESRAFIAALAEAKRPQSAKALAVELIKAGKLSRHQAQAVLQGKIKYLSFGEYLIVEKLGEGGMGQVFKAQHRRMQRTVALKVLSNAAMKNADAIKRFEREVHAAARLMHPNIVTAFDANEHEGVHFLVMEYVDGRDLAALVGEHGPLAPATAIDYVLQAARGLAFAHAKGIVHRDIKPGNLLVDREGTVKILDMGLARIDLSGGGQELTSTGQVMGTVDYMAPEQAEDTRSADARADIYSLGCTLYRVLSGDVLYGGDSIVKKILAHRGADIPSLRQVCPAVPAALETTFRKMVAKKAADRQQTMAEVVAELDAILRDLVRLRPAPVEATIDLKSSDFLAAPGGVVRAGTATVQKSATKVDSATEMTQDLTSQRTTAGLRASPTMNLVQPVATAADTAAQPQRAGFSRKAIGLGIGAVLAALALAAAGVVMFLPAGDGTVRIEVNDPSIEVTVSESGYTVKGKTEDVHIKPGEHTLHVKTGELEFDTSKFMIGKGANPAVKVELLPDKVQVVKADGQQLGEKNRQDAVAGAGDRPPAGPPPTTPAAGGSAAPSASAVASWNEIFNGRDLTGWTQQGHKGWSAKEGVLDGQSPSQVGWLMSDAEYGDFELELEYRLPAGGNSGVFIRAPEDGNVSGSRFNEIQLLDDPSPKFKSVDPKGKTGALFSQVAPTKPTFAVSNTWRKMNINVSGNQVKVAVDGIEVLDTPLRAGTASRGHIGFQLYNPGAQFRNVRIREDNIGSTAASASPSSTQFTAGKPALDFNYRVSDGFARVDLPKVMDATKPLTVELYVTMHAEMGDGNRYLFSTDRGFILQTWSMNTIDWSGPQQGASGPRDLVLARGVLKKGQRTHIAAVSTGSQLRLFVNGQFHGETPITFGLPTGLSWSAFGGKKGGAGTWVPLNGTIDEFRLSQTARYEASFTPPQSMQADKDTLILYDFREGQGETLKDSSGNNHHGKIVGAKWVDVAPASSLRASPSKSALDFNYRVSDGSARVEMPRVLDVSRPFTVELYVTMNTSGNGSMNLPLFAAYQSFILKTWGNNTLDWADPDSNPTKSVRAANLLKRGERAHIAAVSTGSELRLFVNGQLSGKTALDNRPPTGQLWSVLGAAKNASSTWAPLDGLIDEARISSVARYETSFTPPQSMQADKDTLILYDFREGQGETLKDSSANNHHGKIVGAKWVRSAPAEQAKRHALDFKFAADDGTARVQMTHPLDMSKPLTVEMYVQPRSWSDKQSRMLFDGGGRLILKQLNGDLSWHGPRSTSDPRANQVAAMRIVEPNRRMHVTGVSTGQEVRLYVDGKLVGKSQLTVPPQAGGVRCVIGGMSTALQKWEAFDGLIDEVRISTIARYDADFAPEARFSADKDTDTLYYFDEGQGDTLKDSSGNGHHGEIVGAKWVEAGVGSSGAGAATGGTFDR